MSLTLGLSSALSGLMTSQRGLDVVSQNVVNVNTPGYTRKVMTPESVSLSGKGSGVQAGTVNRMVSEGLLKDIRKQNSNTGRLEVEQNYYPRIDDLFGEVGDNSSIAHKLANLQSAFETLGAEANKPATQWSTMQNAQDVADMLDTMTSSLQSMRVEADREIEQTVTKINDLLNNIHDLNQKIVKNGAISTGTGDLEDKRDTAMTELAKLVDIQYYKRTDGSMTIYSNSGQMLLDNQPQPLSYSASSTTDTWMTAASGQFNTITISGGTTDFGPEVTNGKLRALLDLRDTTVPNLQANLDELASEMRTALNEAHNRGTSLPNVSSRYQGTRTFAKQGDIVPTPTTPANPDTAAQFIFGATTITSAAYTNLTIAANAANPWQVNMNASVGTPFAAMSAGQTFSIANAEDSRNNGTYRVVSVNGGGGGITVEKVNVRQTMQLGGSDDVVIATFDSMGNQVKNATLNSIMQTDFSGSYTAATTGSGRSLMDFQAKGDHDQWSINEVGAHVEGWLKSQGYANASVNLDASGKMVVDLGDATVSLAFRDQGSSTAGAAAEDATINFDVNGDGVTDETVQGFSNFFGLNDLYVNDSPAGIMDSAIQPAGYKTNTTRNLELYDTTGKLGNAITIPAGSSLADIAKLINTQTATNESAALNNTAWTLTSPATITVSDASGALQTLTLPPGAHTLEEIAGRLTQGSVVASVVKDGSATRLRLTDNRGHDLSVSMTGGDIAGSTLSLGQTLDMTPTNRIQASVVPEGSGYRLRIRQTTGDTVYAASAPDGNNKNLLSDLGLERAATGSASNLHVRTDIQTAPEKISRGSMQWNADVGRYYLSEGDNTTALEMSRLMTSKSDIDTAGSIYAGKYNFAEYASATISVVAQAANSSKSQYDYQETLNASLEFQNASYSGVNLDEEITSMMDFQQAYSASAKVISVLQEMLDTLTSMIR